MDGSLKEAVTGSSLGDILFRKIGFNDGTGLTENLFYP